ncbi:MAG: alpha/beta hydrolase family protein [Chthoniobacterales bacterium]
MRTGYGQMVQEYWVERVRVQNKDREARLKSIRTRKDAEKYRDYVFEKFGKAFGTMPKKTPLNPIITGAVERKGYRIEKVIFESRPGFLVTADVYVPDNIRKPVPGAIVSCGHAENGKACEGYQTAAKRLVQAGFVVVHYDPISQGERNQHIHLTTKEAVRRHCVQAHSIQGGQLELVGDFFGTWRAWDGIRALDYLIFRPEVDSTRLAMTGNSGGGTMTSWIWGLESRLKVAAPCCFVTPFRYNLENEMPQDSEGCPPGMMADGLEVGDAFIARAPYPILLLGQRYDSFDRRGFSQIAEEVRRFYRFFGAEKNVDAFLGECEHGFHPDVQKALVPFLCKHVKLTKPAKAPELRIETEATLNATREGNVVLAGSIPLFVLAGKAAAKLAAERKSLSKVSLKRELSALLHLPKRDVVPHYRVLRPAPYYTNPKIARYAVETEKGIRVILAKTLADGRRAHTLDVVEKEVHLYFAHLSLEEDLENDPLPKNLRKKQSLYLVDVRGHGESLPSEENNFWHACGKDYMHTTFHDMFRENFLGRRVHDALSVMDLLAAEGAQSIRVYGRGQGALIALFASVLHPKVEFTTLKNAPASYEEWAGALLLKWPAANMVRIILKKMDISDCVKVLGSRVEIVEPWGPDMQPVRGRKR